VETVKQFKYPKIEKFKNSKKVNSNFLIFFKTYWKLYQTFSTGSWLKPMIKGLPAAAHDPDHLEHL
jgi:hypothetical protein